YGQRSPRVSLAEGSTGGCAERPRLTLPQPSPVVHRLRARPRRRTIGLEDVAWATMVRDDDLAFLLDHCLDPRKTGPEITHRAGLHLVILMCSHRSASGSRGLAWRTGRCSQRTSPWRSATVARWDVGAAMGYS